jgi:hypothetical protein
MIVVEAGHVHVMKFLPLSCELSIFVDVTVIFLGEKCGVDCFVLFFFFNCFVPNLTPVCKNKKCTYNICYQFFHEFIHKLFCLHFTNYTKIKS